MTFYYAHKSWSNAPQPNEQTIELWKHVATKSNWRIVQLPNGFYQTECKTLNADNEPNGEWHDITRRETIESAEAAIDGSIEHYNKKLEFAKGPKVVKTFE